MTRRTFCNTTAAALAAQTRGKLPNILLLLADNWAYPHAGALADPVIRTPVFDRLASEGALFVNAFAPTPSCAPSRASLLTGQASHRLEGGANLHGRLPSRFRTYVDELTETGYQCGYSVKGWAPGGVAESGRRRNPAGDEHPGLGPFLESAAGRPFCFWFGSHEPHVPWNRGQGGDRASRLPRVRIPAYLPDHPDVRADIVDYGYEVEQFDRECGEMIEELRRRRLLENTIIVMTSDNGWQMPRGLANVYDTGTRIPLAVWWGKEVASLAGVKRGQRRNEFVTNLDLAPSFVEACGRRPWREMTAQSLWPLLRGQQQLGRDHVFLERERHANVRRGDLTYPVRAIRTAEHLYVWNLEPERWPAGDPEAYFAVGPYGDVDDSRSKRLLMADAGNPGHRIVFGKRPAEELYVLDRDPWQMENRAADPALRAVKERLAARVRTWMQDTADPRSGGRPTDVFDREPYYGPPGRGIAGKAAKGGGR